MYFVRGWVGLCGCVKPGATGVGGMMKMRCDAGPRKPRPEKPEEVCVGYVGNFCGWFPTATCGPVGCGPVEAHCERIGAWTRYRAQRFS